MKVRVYINGWFNIVCFSAILIWVSSCNKGQQCQRLNVNAPLASGDLIAVMNLNSPVWSHMSSYPFRPATVNAPGVREGGTVRFLRDHDHLMIIADMVDSDLVQEDNRNNQPHYQSGDVLEVFIRPPGTQCYWEIYATPNERQTVFFYPSGGRRLPSCLQNKVMAGLTIRVKLKGSLNNYQDRDQGWQCLMVVPLKELEKQCGKLDFLNPWEIQVSRYNYSAYLEKQEFSQLGIATGEKENYHDSTSWALLRME